LSRHGTAATRTEAIEWLYDELAKGRRVLPMGPPCEGFSYETGCPGHLTFEGAGEAVGLQGAQAAHRLGASDVDHDAVGIELFGDKCRIDHKGRTVQRLRRSKNVSAKRMGNHDVVTDFDCKHGNSLRGK
jgi:hypothetical protein